MPVKLNSTGGGSVTLDTPSTASNYTITLPAATSTLLDTTSTQTLTNKTLTAAGSNTVEATSGPTSTQLAGNRNKIINGAMMIDQRNAGAAVTPTDGQYTLDRWAFGVSAASKLTTQQSSTTPTGFINSILVTSSSSYSITATDYFYVFQHVEGLNCSDLGWGTASAQTVTLSFWVRSSLTGTFGGALKNSAVSRSYPFTYTINSANTWEQKTITVAGDQSGTWLTTNGIGIRVQFGLGMGSTYSGTAGTWASANYGSATGAVSVVGTSGATWYVAGVQLEKGATATPFENRLYGTELALCQRYYQLIGNGWGKGVATTSIQFNATFYVPMRTSPSIGATTLRCTDSTTADFTNTSPTVSTNNVDTLGGRYSTNNWSGLTSGTMYLLLPTGTSAAPVQFSAEL